MVRGILAEVLGLPLHKVRVLVDHMGGGFGAKQDLFQTEFLCALLAKQTRRPVRMECPARKRSSAAAPRHPVSIWLKQGFKKDGTITAREAKVAFNTGAYGSHGPGVTIVGTSALTSLYRCENVRLEGRCVYTNTPIAGAFRGYGVVQTYYALDIQMDEAAERLGIDPAELKLKNAVREGDIAPSGHPHHRARPRGLHPPRHCRDRLRRPCAERARNERGPVRTGWGIGCEMHGSSAYPGIKEQGNAIVKMNEDGTVDIAHRHRRAWAPAPTRRWRRSSPRSSACVSRTSRVVHGDTDVVPWDIGAFASHTTFCGRARGADGGGRGQDPAARARRVRTRGRGRGPCRSRAA